MLFYVFTFFPRNAFNRVSRCWTCHVKWVTLNGLNWRCLTNMWWTWKLWIVEFAFGGSAKIVKSSLWYWSEFRSAGKKDGMVVTREKEMIITKCSCFEDKIHKAKLIWCNRILSKIPKSMWKNMEKACLWKSWQIGNYFTFLCKMFCDNFFGYFITKLITVG